MRWISAATILYMAVLTWNFTAVQDSERVAGGLSVMAAGAALFAWALAYARKGDLALAFDPATPDALVKKGPYRFIRNPFYVSYMLCWVGGFICYPSLCLLAVVVVLAALYHLAVRAEERALRQKFGTDYVVYGSKTGRYFPKLLNRTADVARI
jgi:protein-S-isoprenylcysteine O-methyltransferase Ste14